MKQLIWTAALATTALLLPAAPAAGQDAEPEMDAPEAEEPGDDEPGATRERGDGDERRRRRGGRGMRMFELPIERLREPLGLSDEQVSQLQTLTAELREKGEGLRELFQSGDYEAAREQMRSLREEMRTGLGEVLTEEQQEKMRELRRDMGRRGRGFGRGGRGGREAARDRLREQAVDALALGEEEAAVVLPLLDTVLETRTLLLQEREERRQDFLEKVRKETDPDALQALMTDYREAKAADRQATEDAMEQLRQVLTLEQEAKLVGLGVLD